MADTPNDEIKNISQLLTQLEKTAQLLNEGVEKRTEAEEKAAEIRKKAEEKANELHEKGFLKTENEVKQYIEHYEAERAQEKLRNEINILSQISHAQKKEDNKRTKQLEREKKKAQLQTGNVVDRAKAQQMESNEAFAEVFSEAFKKFTNEVKNPGKAIGENIGRDLLNTFKGLGKALEDSLNQVNSAISDYAKYQTAINTRLQGTSNFSNVTNKLSSVAFSPLVNSQNLYQNVNTLINQGIATNVEQRAFLMTIKDSIATTFDANSESLNRLIRLQQQDSTAARLGMESYLTRWLNEYVENTEYLTNTFDNVADSLLETSALLQKTYGVEGATEFEYVVQKWLGTLTGVGLGNSTASAIASALNEIGTGNVSNIGSSGMQNLLIMAASKAGLSYGDLLNRGITAAETNKLMYALTNYLQGIGSSSSNIVKSQLANIFGVNVSDLVAAGNLKIKDLDTVYSNMMSYTDMYAELGSQMSSIKERQGIANILENMFSNFTYQTGMSIASNPATYALWKITDLIQGVTGGINIPFISALGTGVDLNTTVENLMKLGIVGAATLGEIGNIVNGLESLGNAGSLLDLIGISAGSSTNVVRRGSGLSSYGSGAASRVSGFSTSSSGYAGQTDSAAYYEGSLNAAKESAQAEADAAAQQAAENDPTVKYLDELKFADGFQSLVDNVNSMANVGVNLKAFADFNLQTISSWTL